MQNKTAKQVIIEKENTRASAHHRHADGQDINSTLPATGQLEQNTVPLHRLSLRVNFSWVLFGSIISSAGSWVMLIVLAKLADPETVGRYSMGVAISTPVIMFTNIGLRNLLVIDVQKRYDFREYLGLRIITAMLAICIIIGILAFSHLSRETALIVILIALANCINAVCDIIFGLLQANERMDRTAKSTIVKGLLSCILFSLLVYFTHSIVLGVLGLLATALGVLISYDTSSVILVTRQNTMSRSIQQKSALLRPYFHRESMLQMTWTALPLGLVMGLVALIFNIPRYFAHRYLGESGVGIYSAMASIILIGGTVTNSLIEAAIPQLSGHYSARNRQAYQRMLLQLTSIACLIGITEFTVTVLFGKQLLAVIYDPEYAKHMSTFIWLMASSIPLFIAYIFGCGMTASRYFSAQIPVFIVVTICSVVSCILLVPRFGMVALGITAFISATVQCCGGLIVNIIALQHITDTPKEVRSNAYH